MEPLILETVVLILGVLEASTFSQKWLQMTFKLNLSSDSIKNAQEAGLILFEIPDSLKTANLEIMLESMCCCCTTSSTCNEDRCVF